MNISSKTNFLVSLLLLFSVTAFAQKYYTSSGVVTFTSDAAMEKIVSANKQVTCLINTATNDVAFKVIMKSFPFDKQGMYDHFNFKYTESDKFPNSTFSGKFTEPESLTKNGSYKATVEGDLTIHGVTKHVKQTGKVDVADGKISIAATFNIQLPDYGIVIANDYVKRISNTVQLDVNAVLTPYTR